MTGPPAPRQVRVYIPTRGHGVYHLRLPSLHRHWRLEATAVSVMVAPATLGADRLGHYIAGTLLAWSPATPEDADSRLGGLVVAPGAVDLLPLHGLRWDANPADTGWEAALWGVPVATRWAVTRAGAALMTAFAITLTEPEFRP